MSARRSVFAQLALVIALVLLGAAVLALALGRELATRPAAEQLLRAMDSYAAAIEALTGDLPPALAQARLRALGIETSRTEPATRVMTALPLLRELEALAPQMLGAGRVLRLGRRGDGTAAWLRLDRTPALWIALPIERRGDGVLRFSLWMLVGCVALVWLAAGVFARRLVLPLRHLAQSTPGLARGDVAPPVPASVPREVADLGQALAHAGADVRAAAQERALMLAGISHDLRTPLTRVQFALELLPQTDAELRAGIDRDIAEIDAILAQFVAYARDGRDEASEPVDLAAICRQAVGASSQPWRVDVPEYAPLRGKPMALLRAVENLIVNAERHGAAPFELSLRADGGDAASARVPRRVWQVGVRDHGPGLSDAERERVRQPFARGDGGGTGLGLAIVDRVARQHGGSLELDTAAGGGLDATLRLRDAD